MEKTKQHSSSVPQLLNGKELEQGELYSDGQDIYWVEGWDNEKEIVITYKNPPNGALFSDIFEYQKEVLIPFDLFRKFHIND